MAERHLAFTLGGSEEEEEDARLDCWRIFALLALQGNVTSLDFLESRPFVKFVSELGLPAGAGLDQAALNVIFQSHATGLMRGQRRKSVTARIYDSERVDVARKASAGKKLTFECFCAALHTVGARAFAEDGPLCFARLLHERVFPRWHSEPARSLPHAVAQAEAQQFASDAAVVGVVQEFAGELHKLFEWACDVHVASSGTAIQYEQYQSFCTQLLYFTRPQQQLLTKHNLGQIFTFSCGDVRQPAGLLFHEFLMAVSVVAYCALQGAAARRAFGEQELTRASPVSRIKWLLHRMYSSPARTETKLPQMAPFNRAFATMYRDDGAPRSYIDEDPDAETAAGGEGEGDGEGEGGGGFVVEAGSGRLRGVFDSGTSNGAEAMTAAAAAAAAAASASEHEYDYDTGDDARGGDDSAERTAAATIAGLNAAVAGSSESATAPPPAPPMPAHIDREFDASSGRYYFVNTRTEQTAWSLAEAIELDGEGAGSQEQHEAARGQLPAGTMDAIDGLTAAEFFGAAKMLITDADAHALWQILCAKRRR